MAKADCSELDLVITEIARDLMADKDIKNLDDVVFELQKTFPIIPRDEVIQSIQDATATERQAATEEQRKWRSILHEVKDDPALKEDRERAGQFLETGTLPEPEAKPPSREVSETLAELKTIRDNANKWLKTSDPAMKIKLQERLDALNARIERGDIVIDAKRKGELHESLQGLQDQINAARRQIADAKTFQKINDQIDTFQKHLYEGTLPEKTVRAKRGEGVLDNMRNIRDGLRRKLEQSPPAVRERLQKHIDALQETMAKIEAGTYEVPVKQTKTPLTKELEIMEFKRDQLRKEVRLRIENLRPKSWWTRYNPFAFFHDLIVNGELSIVLRQGGLTNVARLGATIESVATGEPTAAPLKQAGAEIQALFDTLIHPARRTEVMAELMARDSTRRFIRGGGHISPLAGGEMSQREEFALSHLALKIPIMRDFAQAGTVFLNLMRINAFESMSETLALNGNPTAAEMKIIANMANQATGRGYEGGGPLGDGARMFFSLQYLMSRWNMLSFQPIRGNWELDAPMARKVVAREYARIFLGLGAMYMLAALAGAEIEKDPTSSDFLKWKWGRHRVDPLMGFNQMIVFGSRLGFGERKSAQTGKITALRGEDLQYGQKTARDVIWDYLQSKAAPLPGFVMNITSGRKMTGEPTNLTKEFTGLIIPLTWVDIYHAMEEGDVPTDAAVSMLTFFGMGLQTFQPEEWPRNKSRRRTR